MTPSYVKLLDSKEYWGLYPGRGHLHGFDSSSAICHLAVVLLVILLILLHPSIYHDISAFIPSAFLLFPPLHFWNDARGRMQLMRWCKPPYISSRENNTV